MHIIYKQASKTLEYTLEYTLEVTSKQPSLNNNKLTQETTLELTRVFDPTQYSCKPSWLKIKKNLVEYRLLEPPTGKKSGGISDKSSGGNTEKNLVDLASALSVLKRTSKMNNPFYYEAVKKRQANPFQYRYDKMLNKLRHKYSADRFVSLLKALSSSTLTERDNWLRRMEDAER